MAIIPEIIIQDVIVKGLTELKRDPWRIHQIFRTAPQNFVNSYVNLLCETPIDVVMNYPREDAKFPCISILLRGEQESHTLIGNFLSGGYDSEGLASFGVDELFYTSGETSTDSTLGSGIYGEPRRLFDSNANKYLEQRGSGMSVSYLVQVMTDDQDFTVFLYSTLKYILLSNMLRFEKEGFLEMNIGGSDFLPQTTHQPNFVFIRGITLSFVNFFDFFVDPNAEALLGKDGEFLIAKGIELELTDSTDSTDKEYGTWAMRQVPQIRNLYTLYTETNMPVVSDPSSVAAIGQYTYDTTGVVGTRGAVITNIIAEGINLHLGAGFRISNSFGDTLNILGKRTPPIYLSMSVGAASSTTTRFDSSAAEDVPPSVIPGTYLSVIAPETHLAFGEERLITLVTSGAAGTITVDSAFSAELDGATVKVVGLDTSPQVEIIDEIQNVMFDSTLTGQSTSSTLVFRAGVSDTVPSNLLNGMYLQVVGPKTHSSYSETNRVISAVSGAGGAITVVTPFSSSLTGAAVRVVERQDFLRFSVYVPSGARTGKYDITVINSDLIEDTLVGGLTVA